MHLYTHGVRRAHGGSRCGCGLTITTAHWSIIIIKTEKLIGQVLYFFLIFLILKRYCDTHTDMRYTVRIDCYDFKFVNTLSHAIRGHQCVKSNIVKVNI